MDNKREFMRFGVDLKVKAEKANSSYNGVIKDFSRRGLKAVFNEFDFELNSPFELKIQKPGTDEWIGAHAQAVWRKQEQGKCDVGIKLCLLTAENKAQILEYGYFKWLKENVFSLAK